MNDIQKQITRFREFASADIVIDRLCKLEQMIKDQEPVQPKQEKKCGNTSDDYEVGFSFLGLGITITFSWIKDSAQDGRDRE